MLFPLHIVVSFPAFATTAGFTLTTTLSEVVQPFISVVTTVYVVVIGGVATGL